MFRGRASLQLNFLVLFEATSLARGPQIDLGAREGSLVLSANRMALRCGPVFSVRVEPRARMVVARIMPHPPVPQSNGASMLRVAAVSYARGDAALP